MRRRWAFFFAAACAASIAAITTVGAQDHYLSGYVGAYNCTAGNEHYSMNISSELNGRAIRVDSRGGYETMEGRPAGNSISYREVYPARTDTMVESRPSANMFSEVYTTISNGKAQNIHDTCTRR